MTDPLIEEAAKMAAQRFNQEPGWDWLDVATAMRDFWAAHSTPGDIDKATAYREAREFLVCDKDYNSGILLARPDVMVGLERVRREREARIE